MDHGLDLTGFRMSFCVDQSKIPFDVPSNWIVFNAPRPLYGDICEKGDWHHGIFYAAVCPFSKVAKRDVSNNRILDATLILRATPKAMIDFGKKFIPKNYLHLYEKADERTANRAAIYYADRALDELHYNLVMEALA